MTGSLDAVAPGVGVWLQEAAHSTPNAAVVIDDDGLTVVDTLLSPTMAQPFALACADLDLLVRRVVLTSSHLEYVGGSSLFSLAAVYGSAQTSALLDQPPNLAALRHLHASHAAELDDTIATRTVTHTVTEAAWISPSAVAVPVSGHQHENLVIQVPNEGVVLLGAMGWFGVTPLAFDGDPAAWADSLDTILGYGSVFVPGHGPPGGPEQVRDLQAYLRACVDADGDPARLGAGPWDDWTCRHFDAVNVERAARLARGDRTPPTAMLRLLGLD